MAHTIRIILAAALLGMGMPAMAQTPAKGVKELPVYDSTKSEKLVEMNLHGGVGLSSVIQNYGSAIPGLSDFMLAPGCLMRAGIDVRFDIRNSFGIGTGFEASINNSRFALSMIENTTGSISSIYINNHFYDLNIPVYMSWRLNIGSRMMWNIDLGMYVSYGLGGTMKASGYTSGENSLGQPIVTHAVYKSGYFNDDRPYINAIKRMDWGPRLATGLIYKRKYSLGVVLQVGAKNLAINQGAIDAKYRNLSLAFQIGYYIF